MSEGMFLDDQELCAHVEQKLGEGAVVPEGSELPNSRTGKEEGVASAFQR